MQTTSYLEIGDKVTFDTDKIDAFKEETNTDNKEIQQYRQLVLAGVNQVGTVKDCQGALVTVSYPDGWQLPVPANTF